jgi:hypothetical protein
MMRYQLSGAQRPADADRSGPLVRLLAAAADPSPARCIRSICLTLLAATSAVVVGTGPVKADPCTDSYGWFSQPGSPDRIPDCELQKQPTLTFDSSFSSGYAFYCTNDYNGNFSDKHAYFWGLAAGYSRSFTWDNSCFTVSENSTVEQGGFLGYSKLDVTISNWCLSEETITITLACSTQLPPDHG